MHNRPDKADLPAELQQAELAAVRARRAALDLPLDPDESVGRVGLALSGGGIRSATFALGLLQSLARQRALRHVDYLSTVSGGGYIGAFLGSLYVPQAERDPWANDAGPEPAACAAPSPEATVTHVEHMLADSGSRPLQWLREHGRYMAPRGAGDYLYGVAVMVRNWVALHYVFAVTVLTAFLAAGTVRALLWRWPWWQEIESGLLMVDSTPPFWFSPWLLLPALGLVLCLVPLGWAYWLTQTSPGRPHRALSNPALLTTGLLAAMGIVLVFTYAGNSGRFTSTSPVFRAGLIVLWAGLAALFWSQAEVRPPHEPAARNRLSSWLARALGIVLVLLGWALVDTLGYNVYRLVARPGLSGWALLGLGVPLLVALAQRLAPLAAPVGVRQEGLRLSSMVLLSFLGVLLFVVLLVSWSAVSHAILWSPSAEVPAQAPATPHLLRVLLASLALGLVSWLIGRTIPFLNLSTLAQFYASRLERAYLGASNPRRTACAPGDEPTARNVGTLRDDVTRLEPGDDIAWDAYHPERHGGPLHLVNVTVNQTVSRSSHLIQRDRKGLPLAVGPCGLSVGCHHHALWGDSASRIIPLAVPGEDVPVLAADHEPAHPRKVEALSLARWIAISGAAFTTGLGARTRIGLSMLLALSNVRLGHWWNSGMKPGRRAGSTRRRLLDQPGLLLSRLLPVQSHLADETFARFHGPDRLRWYLSDGGHFENTGAYELLRRRVPFIIVCNSGQDPDYRFGDIGNLVRKARLDWNAEIRFLDQAELEALLGDDSSLLGQIGTAAQLQRRLAGEAAIEASLLDGLAWSQRHAALAWARYGDDPQPGSLLLFIQPTLTGDEPADVLQYYNEHPMFPQESTLDQFFDEAQWESYRRLGMHVGERLFAPASLDGHWAPSQMQAPPWRPGKQPEPPMTAATRP